MAELITAKYVRTNTTRPSRHAQVTAPIPFLKSTEDYGDLGFHMSWKCITVPYTDESETHRHDFNQFLVFLGGNPNSMSAIRSPSMNSLDPVTYEALILPERELK